MTAKSQSKHVFVELAAYVVGYLTTVPLIGFSLLAWLAQGTGSVILSMLVAPLCCWGLTWAYAIAFEGAKAMPVAQLGRALIDAIASSLRPNMRGSLVLARAVRHPRPTHQRRRGA